jgi:cell wall-associated NlpC family hydrolase
MVKQILTIIGVSAIFSSCTAFKSLNLQGNKQPPVTAAPSTTVVTPNKFIEDITVTPTIDQQKPAAKNELLMQSANKGPAVVVTPPKEDFVPVKTLTDRINPSYVENASPVQFKYAILMNTEVEALPNKLLLDAVDQWYGVRYRIGGTDKSGIDCSAFALAVYAAAYGITLPRVSREQYRNSRKISATELKEGDLVFFNTRGRGVSHVGIYLGNNHFAHSSVSKGVTVSSLFEPYYLQRFVGAGRIDEKEIIAGN